MRAETLEGGDMINGPPTALEEPPVPSPIYPHHPPIHPPQLQLHPSPGLITKKTRSPKTRAFKVAENDFRQILFLWILGYASRDIPHSPQPWWLNYDPPNPPHPPPSLSLNVNSSKFRALKRILQESLEEVFTTFESDRLKGKKCETAPFIWGTHTEKLHLT